MAWNVCYLSPLQSPSVAISAHHHRTTAQLQLWDCALACSADFQLLLLLLQQNYIHFALLPLRNLSYSVVKSTTPAVTPAKSANVLISSIKQLLPMTIMRRLCKKRKAWLSNSVSVSPIHQNSASLLGGLISTPFVRVSWRKYHSSPSESKMARASSYKHEDSSSSPSICTMSHTAVGSFKTAKTLCLHTNCRKVIHSLRLTVKRTHEHSFTATAVLLRKLVR